MKTVYCPVKKEQINGDECVLICDVADRILIPSVLQENIIWSDEKQAICKKCMYHKDLE